MPLSQDSANALRMLSIDAIEKAQSGHPGMPMGMADIATVLWQNHLKYNPLNPEWFDRDRFVLSNGHGSMLLYALLHLTGFELSIDDLKQFRQLHSKTPGHPELNETPGVETTTGPLGQGLANAVGLALAERTLATKFNKPDLSIVDHHTYAFVGDGCLMEGISHEVSSLAGTLGLGKLIVIYDDNGISIDGNIEPWYSEDVAARFRSYHWQVIDGVDGHDSHAIDRALTEAKHNQSQPTLICCKTAIGFGSPNKKGSASVHGSPLGYEEVQTVRETLGWEHPPFVIPQEVYQAWDHKVQGSEEEIEWNDLFVAYEQAYPELAAEFLRRQYGVLPDNWLFESEEWVKNCQEEKATIATRKASQQALNKIGHILPELIGGSADLTGSNLTNWTDSVAITHDQPNGNYIHYGVREFGMAAIMNGLALHGGFIPYGGTFLVFSDYARNAIRLRAMMGLKVISVLTHDSIGLGEDGPTHQPIEHIASLRLIPNLHVWRPADAVETMVAWTAACSYQGPSALLFSRQKLQHLERNDATTESIVKGGYVYFEPKDDIDVIIMATGSEVNIAINAANKLAEDDIAARVVSMPCCEVFEKQDLEYQSSVLPSSVRVRVAIEAGSTQYWWKWVGSDGDVVGIDQFGCSAPIDDVYETLNITSKRLVEVVKQTLAKNKKTVY